LYVQNRRGISSQRGDHAATADMVREIRDDQREMKADLRDVKDEVRSHGDRLRSLEHMTAVQDHTDHVVADNGRKLQAIQEHQSKEQAS
jgi:predicted glycosyltransferase